MEKFDVIAIGAGVNGLGIAREAALQGLKVLLLEQDDLCSGVSAWSGRLAHGGLRYLEHYDFALVRESLLERERLFTNAPHLANPVSWMMPVYRHNKRPMWIVKIGMTFFDLLSFGKTSPRHKYLSREATIKRFPGIDQSGLKGGFQYWDGQISLAERLCVEIALDAISAGAVIRTHSRVEAPLLNDSKVVGVRYRDTDTNELIDVEAPVVYNVAGPWIDRIFASKVGLPDQPRLNGGTKGSHLVVNEFPGAPKDVVYYETRSDGRLILVVPWLDKYLIGTTDIRWERDPSEARCDIGELEYLVNEVNALVPSAQLTKSDVLYTYSGVRPLPHEPHKPESQVTRTHILYDHAKNGLPGLVTVVGGKLTTARQLAEDAVKDINTRLNKPKGRSATRHRKLPGAHFASRKSLEQDLRRIGASEPAVKRLANMYGSRAIELWSTYNKNLSEIYIDEKLGLTFGEVQFVLAQEFPKTLTDVMARRLLLAFESGHGMEHLETIVNILKPFFGWSNEKTQEEIVNYSKWLDHLAVPSEDGPRSTSFGGGVTVSGGAK